MQQRNIFAHTAPGSNYPEYLSVNERDGAITVTVRGPVKPAGSGDVPFDMSGDTACMTLPREQAEGLCRALFAEFFGSRFAWAERN